jgi:hypothetical protein
MYHDKIKTTSDNWYDIPNPFGDLELRPNPVVTIDLPTQAQADVPF